MFNSFAKKMIAVVTAVSLIVGGGVALYVKGNKSAETANAKTDNNAENSDIVRFNPDEVPSFDELVSKKEKLPVKQQKQLERDQIAMEKAEEGIVNCDTSQDPEKFKKRVAENVLRYINSLPSSKEESTIESVEEAKVEIKPSVSAERIEALSEDGVALLSINKEAILYSLADSNYAELHMETCLASDGIEFSASEGLSVFPRGNIVGVSVSPQAIDETKELKVKVIAKGQETEIVCSVNVIGYESEVKDTNGNNIYTDQDCKNVVTFANYTAEGTYYTTVEEQKVIYHGWQTINGKKYYFDEKGEKLTGTQMIDGELFYFDATGALSSEENIMKKSALGIDVSYHQGAIDWVKVAAAGVKFAIIRCGYRGYGAGGSLNEDTMFATNLRGAKAAGIITGSYFYSTALNTTEAIAEANYAMTIVNRCGGCSLPVFIDMEDDKRGQTSLDRNTLTLIANYFCYTVTNTYNMTSGIYASKSWLENRMVAGSFLPTMYVWVAQWNSSCTYSGKYALWQFSDKGSINGISGAVDLDIWYV